MLLIYHLCYSDLLNEDLIYSQQRINYLFTNYLNKHKNMTSGSTFGECWESRGIVLSMGDKKEAAKRGNLIY